MRFSDQTGVSFQLQGRPKRIVSLVPSITESLHDLGLETEVVGITRFCVHPKVWFNTKTRIGGTKDPRIEQIRSLQPDLIIANKEENNADDVFALREFCPVWVSDVHNLESAIEMIQRLGELTGTRDKADSLASEIKQEFNELSRFIQDRSTSRIKALYFIWKDPWMVAGSDTFISDLILRCGWTNAENRKRYPEWDFKNSKSSHIDLVLLSSEPYPFREQNQQELKELFPNATIHLVDGEFFSWYGSRLQFAPAYFRELIRALYSG